MGKLDRKRALKLRFRRGLRLQKRQVEELSAVAEQGLENNFFKRLEHLSKVRNFVGSWILLVLLLMGAVVAQMRALSGYYQTLQPVPGGTYAEGVLGVFTNANPVYATGLADTTVSHLVFSGLLTYDARNQLAGDLAQSWSVDDRGTTYTVHLRRGLTWQDGMPLTAADVLFTYQVIQNPDARSPFYGSWQGITVAAPDPLTVTFTLPNTLASFPYSLTNGIIPQHILGSVSMADMRSTAFNTTQPVGSGPFQWQAIQLTGNNTENRQEHIALKAFAGYHFGKPKLNGFVVRTFRSSGPLIASFQAEEVNAVVGLTAAPPRLQNNGSVHIYDLPLTAAVMSFFDTAHGVTNDPVVRRALIAGTDVPAIINTLGYATQPVREPLLHGQLAYDPQYEQSAYNPAGANKVLDDAGWARGKNGLRSKNGTPLKLTMYYHSSNEYTAVAAQLAKYWRALGVDVRLLGQNDADFQNTLSQAPSPASSSYDALLYGISIGVDPDVYVYWDGTQADPRSPIRLNYSAYSNGTADASLEAGRTRLDPTLRTLKYLSFLQDWQADAPALGLYQPRFLYITRGPVFGLTETPVNTDAQRFWNVHNWEVREARK